MSNQEDKEAVLKGFTPVASQIYLEKQPNLSLFCKPLILPLKSPNLQMIEKMEAAANVKDIEIPSVLDSSDK